MQNIYYEYIMHILCKILRISRKKSPSPIFPYQLDGNVLEHVSDIKDLGVTVSFDLQWTRHIEQTTAKANRTLGLVKRVCRDVGDIRTRRLLYCTLVRPQLEYCSSLWSPYTTKHRALVENVQRRATKFILNYPQSNVSYIDRLTILDLLPLEHRRSIKDIILFHKFKSGIMPIDVISFLTLPIVFVQLVTLIQVTSKSMYNISKIILDSPSFLEL